MEEETEMNEQEEFEFRLRLERELESSASKKEADLASKIAANPATQFAVGSAEPLLGFIQRLGSGGQYVRQAFPALSTLASAAKPAVDQGLSQFNAMAEEGGAGAGAKVARFGGNVLSPASLWISKVQPAATLPGNMALGSAAGAAGGFFAPAESEEQARRNAALGGLFGGVLPAAITAGGKAYDSVRKIGSDTLDLFRKSGPENILRRYIESPKVVGKDALPSIIDAAKNVDPIIPGGAPTVAQATSGKPGGSPLSALERVTSSTGGGQSDKFMARVAEQASAIDAAKAARKAASDVNYAKAFDPKLHPPKVDDELRAIFDNPYARDAVPAAEKLAQAKKLTPDENMYEILHAVKVGLDKKLKGGIKEEAIDAMTYREITDVKNRLTEWLSKNNKDYDVGRKEFAEASKAIEKFIERQDAAKSPVVKTNLGGGLNISEETRAHLPNLLSRPAMLANFLMRKAGRDVEPKVDSLAADMLLNPLQFSEMMSKATPQQKIDITRAIQRANALNFGAASAQ